jgi:hypothetical protein
MKRPIAKLLIVFACFLLSFKTGDDLETEKYRMFMASIRNFSTFSYFTVPGALHKRGLLVSAQFSIPGNR